MSEFTFKKTTYTINGKTYNSLDEVPPEFREMLKKMELPKSAAVNVNRTVIIGGQDQETPEGPQDLHRERFFRESVLPNLEKMDDTAIQEVMSELAPEPAGIRSILIRYHDPLWLNFSFAFWLAVLATSATFFSRFTGDPSLEPAWGLFGPFWTAPVLLVLWFGLIRKDNARAGGFLLGLLAALIIIMQLFTPSTDFTFLKFLFACYVGISGFLYSGTGEKKRALNTRFPL